MPSGYPFSREVRREFLGLVCQGIPVIQAERVVGVSLNTGSRWWRAAGNGWTPWHGTCPPTGWRRPASRPTSSTDPQHCGQRTRSKPGSGRSKGIRLLSKALEKTYDGIIIGAGHHGLILGSYLARAGLNILLVERRLTYGGGLCTREVTLPGFYHNLHSINHFHISETPWFKDLNLGDRVTFSTLEVRINSANF